MSNLVDQLEIFENCDIKNEIKYYYVLGYDKKDKFALFVTNDDKVYGINIPEWMMTSSFKNQNEERENKDLENSKRIEIKELSDKNVEEFHIGVDFVLAFSEENKLYSWGHNEYGQLGRYTGNNYDCEPSEIIFFTNSKSKIKQICVHFRTVMVLLDNGKVIVWGNNEIGLTGKLRFGVYFTEIFNWKCIRYQREIYTLKQIEFIYMNNESCFGIDMNSDVFIGDYFFSHFPTLSGKKYFSHFPTLSGKKYFSMTLYDMT